MAEDWNSYVCNVNGKLASIFVDLNLISRIPVHSKPWLLWVWIYFKSPRPDGLSDSGEATTLFSIEDKLNDALRSCCGALFAGRITTDGRREFYYYSEHDDQIETRILEVLRASSGYKFDCGSRKDPEWRHYLDVLYPSPEDLQKIKNSKVLDVLKSHGDDATSVREVRHWIYFQTEADRNDYVTEVTQMGYKDCGFCEGTDPLPFGIVIARDQPATDDAIDESVVNLCRLAEKYQAEYDGWETEVQIVK